MVFHQQHWFRAVFAEILAIGALVMGYQIVDDPKMVMSMARGLATPLTWPKLMLAGVGLCALGWAVEEGWKAFHALPPPPDAMTEALEFGDVGFEDEKETPPLLPIVLGLALALVYAFAIPLVGFTTATVLFLMLWFVLGGIRKPVSVVAVTLIGTMIILYVFVKLALMPLDKGVGIFGEFTVALFKLLGIY